MRKNSSEIIAEEKRCESRSKKQRDYRVEIKFIGEPIYQFRVIDSSNNGASLLIKDDSRFLELISVHPRI